MNAIAVTVVIVNWNGEKYIAKCIESLLLKTKKTSSIIMVDNGSSDSSLELVRENFVTVKIVVFDKNYGFAIGNNITLKEVSTEFVALLNNDAMPHPDWLEKLVDALENHPEAGFCGLEDAFLSQTGPDRSGRGCLYNRWNGIVARTREKRRRLLPKRICFWCLCRGGLVSNRNVEGHRLVRRGFFSALRGRGSQFPSAAPGIQVHLRAGGRRASRRQRQHR
jgi:glycosyltransferase involved in cell wall biosynthesis